MAYAVLPRTTPTPQPRSFPSAHPGYGAGAAQALDERLAEELATRRTRPAPTAPSTATAKTTEYSTAGIDAQLAAARKITAKAKKAYEAAVAAEKGLEKQRELVIERQKRLKGVKEDRAEKARRREVALGIGRVQGGRVEKVVERIEGSRKVGGGFLEK
jgi:hypothetical protein